MVKNIFAAFGVASLAVFALLLIYSAVTGSIVPLGLIIVCLIMLFFGTVILAAIIGN